MYTTWRHNGNWRTQSPAGTAASDGTATLALKSTDVVSSLEVIYCPWMLIHVSPQLLEGVANARNTIRIRHDIGMQRSVDYRFEVQANELHTSLLYLGAEIVDTIAAYTGLTIGKLELDGTRTTAEKAKLQVDFEGLTEGSQVYLDIPSRDHPLSEMLIESVLSYMR